MMDDRSDAALLGAAEHDEGAFVELVERHHRSLGRYATRRLGPDRAVDIVNETFAVAYRRRFTYDDRHADVRPWLLGIATNLIRRESRREARQLRAFARRGIDPVAADTPHADIDPVLAGVLASLRKEHRDVLFLHAVAGLTTRRSPRRSTSRWVPHAAGSRGRGRRPPRN